MFAGVLARVLAAGVAGSFRADESRAGREVTPCSPTVRPRGAPTCGFAHRPLQPALRLLHARRGPRLAAASPSCSPTTRSSGWCGIGVERLGVTEVRFTGGEPLLRRGLTDIVAGTAALRPRPEISLTTNGIGLDRLAEPLRAAGLDRVNVSLDTLRPHVPHAGPAGPARRRARRAGRGRRSRARAGQGQRRADARRQRRRGACRCSGSAWSTATSSGSSSRCRWTRSTAGAARTW